MSTDRQTIDRLTDGLIDCSGHISMDEMVMAKELCAKEGLMVSIASIVSGVSGVSVVSVVVIVCSRCPFIVI